MQNQYWRDLQIQTHLKALLLQNIQDVYLCSLRNLKNQLNVLMQAWKEFIHLECLICTKLSLILNQKISLMIAYLI